MTAAYFVSLPGSTQRVFHLLRRDFPTVNYGFVVSVMFDSEGSWIKKEHGEAGAVSKMLMNKPSELIVQSEMQWMPQSWV